LVEGLGGVQFVVELGLFFALLASEIRE